MTTCNDSYLERLGSFADDDRALERLADLIAESTGERRIQVAAEYELFLLAARRPDLRAELGRWTDALDAFLARFVDDPVDRAGATAAVDGLFLRCFCADQPPDATETLEILRRLTRSRRTSRDGTHRSVRR